LAVVVEDLLGHNFLGLPWRLLQLYLCQQPSVHLQQTRQQDMTSGVPRLKFQAPHSVERTLLP